MATIDDIQGAANFRSVGKPPHPFVQSAAHGAPRGRHRNAHACAQASERQTLQGTSTLHGETERPALDPPAQLEAIFEEIVAPFFEEYPGFGVPTDRGELQELFHWVTTAVAAYSFELGDEGFHVRRMRAVPVCLAHQRGLASSMHRARALRQAAQRLTAQMRAPRAGDAGCVSGDSRIACLAVRLRHVHR